MRRKIRSSGKWMHDVSVVVRVWATNDGSVRTSKFIWKMVKSALKAKLNAYNNRVTFESHFLLVSFSKHFRRECVDLALLASFNELLRCHHQLPIRHEKKPTDHHHWLVILREHSLQCLCHIYHCAIGCIAIYDMDIGHTPCNTCMIAMLCANYKRMR